MTKMVMMMMMTVAMAVINDGDDSDDGDGGNGECCDYSQCRLSILTTASAGIAAEDGEDR